MSKRQQYVSGEYPANLEPVVEARDQDNVAP